MSESYGELGRGVLRGMGYLCHHLDGAAQTLLTPSIHLGFIGTVAGPLDITSYAPVLSIGTKTWLETVSSLDESC
jgi:hypothetical protein